MIITNRPEHASIIRDLFSDVKNFNHQEGTSPGSNEVISFFLYLCERSPYLNKFFEFNLANQLQCQKCLHKRTRNITYKYFPVYVSRTDTDNGIHLESLVKDQTMKKSLTHGANCFACDTQDSPTLSSYHGNPSLLLISIENLELRKRDSEVERLDVKKGKKKKRRRGNWDYRKRPRKKISEGEKIDVIKLEQEINFDPNHLRFHNLMRSYEAVASIHGGATKKGHFYCINRSTHTWMNNDDLQEQAEETEPPGDKDDSVHLVLLEAKGSSREDSKITYFR